MANSNPQAVAFANERARVLADSYVDLYETGRKFLDEYDARALDAAYPDTADAIEDGAASDGRPVVNNRHLRSMAAVSRQVAAWFEAVPAGWPSARIVLFRQVAVNGRSRF